MDRLQEKTTAPYPPVGADGGQSLSQKPNQSIAEGVTEHKPPERDLEEILRQISRVNDPAYLPTVSMNDLYEQVYPGRPPVVDGLLYAGTYLFVGAPKVGKSFLMAQLAYHVSMGLSLWGYEVRQGTVLYLALEDNHRRLQERLYRMFGVESTGNLFFAIGAKQLGGGLEEQLKGFVREHTDTRLIIIDTLQKIREAGAEKYSYANGLLGAADGAFLLQKERRADNAATLDISGRDQQDQRLYLKRDEERLVWELERRETELRQEPPDPVLEAVAALVTAERPEWRGTATELVAALGLDMKPNALAMRLNVRAWRLSYEYHIHYESARTHAGRSIKLTLEEPQA